MYEGAAALVVSAHDPQAAERVLAAARRLSRELPTSRPVATAC
jgi:hypothetical protein